MDQERPDMLGLSGKFLVASELLRRDIPVATIYGTNEKNSVTVIIGTAAIPIEVRTTRDGKWSSIPHPIKAIDSVWVFVHLPRDRSHGEAFVLTGAELNNIFEPKHREYLERRVQTPFRLSRTHYSIERDQIEHCSRAWQKVTDVLGLPRGDWPPVPTSHSSTDSASQMST